MTADAGGTGVPATEASESGFTLVEMSVALVLLGIIIGLLTPTFLSVSDSASRTEAQTTVDSAIRPAMIELSRQIESASFLYNPCTDAVSYSNSGTSPSAGCANGGFALLVYSTSANGGECTQWQVVKDSNNRIDPKNANESDLQVRTWDPTASPAPANVPFVTLTSGIVMVNTSSQPPFVTTISASQTGLVKVDLWASSGSLSPSIEIKTSVAAQGESLVTTATTASPPNPCSSTPTT